MVLSENCVDACANTLSALGEKGREGALPQAQEGEMDRRRRL